MTKKQLALEAIAKLKERYPEAVCSLTYQKPYELLLAVRLSAQCTDARVNIVTQELFAQYPTLESIAQADIADIERIVKPCGLYKTKAKQLVQAAQMLISDYGGVVPDSMEELLKLPGIGRKTANLSLGDVYGQPSYVCDTHCIRITGRLGITDGSKDPVKVEQQLRKAIPPAESGPFCHRMVLFGRDVCTARSPKCEDCPLKADCAQGKKLK